MADTLGSLFSGTAAAGPASEATTAAMAAQRAGEIGNPAFATSMSPSASMFSAGGGTTPGMLDASSVAKLLDGALTTDNLQKAVGAARMMRGQGGAPQFPPGLPARSAGPRPTPSALQFLRMLQTPARGDSMAAIRALLGGGG